jgi:short-subunit dehydrogenase
MPKKYKGMNQDNGGSAREASPSDGAFSGAGGDRPLAVVTGASSGIGYELARVCAMHGYDLVVAASSSKIKESAQRLSKLGVDVRAVQTDLATERGVDTLYNAAKSLNRPVEVLCANAGRGLGHAFLDQDWQEIKRVIDTNVTGTAYLLQKFARDMVSRGAGRILITGSIAGVIPGTYQAVYNATKAFVDNFSYALRHEIGDKGVTVTCLMPGGTATEFFEKAGMMDTPIGQAEKDDALDVALVGFGALMSNKGSVVYGLKNKLQVAAARVAPQGWMAEAHRMQAQPSGEQR